MTTEGELTWITAGGLDGKSWITVLGIEGIHTHPVEHYLTSFEIVTEQGDPKARLRGITTQEADDVRRGFHESDTRRVIPRGGRGIVG